MVVATLVKEIIAHRCQSFLSVANIAMFFQTAKRKWGKHLAVFYDWVQCVIIEM